MKHSIVVLGDLTANHLINETFAVYSKFKFIAAFTSAYHGTYPKPDTFSTDPISPL